MDSTPRHRGYVGRVAFRAAAARVRWSSPAAAMVILLGLAAPLVGEEPEVTITGGLQPDGSFYRWEVTNRGSSPVISLEFPHYQADQFIQPPGWRSKSEYLVNLGVEDRPGTCRAWVDSPKDGIPRRGKVSVGMRVRLLEARQGRGVVKVGLADGTTLEIANVEVPVPPGYFERFGVLICFLIMFGLLILYTARRRRRQQRQAASAAADAVDEGESGPPTTASGT